MSRKTKKILRWLMWCGGILGFVVVSVAAASRQYKIPCQEEVEVHFTASKDLFFLNKHDILELLDQSGMNSFRGRAVAEMPADAIEEFLMSNAYVASADAYVDMHGKLSIDVIQRQPILRVINRKGVSYYVDVTGNKIPISNKFTARVPVISGYVEDNGQSTGQIQSQRLKEAYSLILKIRQDKLFQALTEQVYIDKKGHYHLVPKAGEFLINFGTAENLDAKLKRLDILYREVMSKIDLSKYEVIDLQYENQLVARKKRIANG